MKETLHRIAQIILANSGSNIRPEQAQNNNEQQQSKDIDTITTTKQQSEGDTATQQNTA
jgi:hypothetical protein